MIDTINLQLPKNILQPDYFQQHEQLFNNVRETKSKFEITYVGNYRNFLIKQNNDGVFLYGSLSKYYLGTNQKTLRENEIQKAFNKLAVELNLPIHKAKVNRVDTAENLITEQKVSFYYPYLGEAKYFKRSEVEGNIYYKSRYRNQIISMYDKIKDVRRDKHENIDKIFSGRNVLRVEYRFSTHRSLANYLGLVNVTVEDLILCYPDLVNAWYKVIQTINKRRDLIGFKQQVFKEKGQFDKQVLIMGVEAMGGLSLITDSIRLAAKSGQLVYPNQASYLIKKYKALMATPKLTYPSPLVEELEYKMKIAHFVNAERKAINYDNLF